MKYLHAQEPPIIHRDIKPQNIKITPSGKAVLVDFGIAKIAELDEKTSEGATGVTPGFSPPEQYSGTGTAEVSDVYSLGATLYAILTAKRPPDSISVMADGAVFEPPHSINNTLSRHVSNAIVHAMQGSKQSRPQSILEWQRELGLFMGIDENKTIDEEVSLWLIASDGRSYELNKGSLTIGRSSQRDIVLNDKKVSRKHAFLKFDGRNCMVYDEGSNNGTFVNDRPVTRSGMPFRTGDRLRVGQTVFSLDYKRQDASPTFRPAPTIDSKIQTEQQKKENPPRALAWEEDDMSGITSMTYMLTQNIMRKTESMSTTQVVALAMGLIAAFGVGAWLVTDFIRITVPTIFFMFTSFYYIPGLVVYGVSRYRGSGVGVHVIVQMLVTILTWTNPPYVLLLVSSLLGGLILEGSFYVPKIPDWLRFPGAIILAYLFHTIILNLEYLLTNVLSYLGSILIGLLVYVILESYKGYQKARETMLRTKTN